MTEVTQSKNTECPKCDGFGIDENNHVSGEYGETCGECNGTGIYTPKSATEHPADEDGR